MGTRYYHYSPLSRVRLRLLSRVLSMLMARWPYVTDRTLYGDFRDAFDLAVQDIPTENVYDQRFPVEEHQS